MFDSHEPETDKTKNMKVKLFIIVSIFFVLSMGCKKNEETKYDLIPVEFKAWTVFQNRSFWIFLNEKTNQTDSTYVTNCEQSLATDNNSSNPLYTESYYVRFSSSFVNNFYLIAGTDSSARQNIDEYHTNGLALTMDRLNNPNVQSGNIDPAYKSKVVEVIPNLVLNNDTFTHVYNILWAYKERTGDSVVENYYMAKNIGLIKFRTKIGNADTTWSLLRWHVVQ